MPGLQERLVQTIHSKGGAGEMFESNQELGSSRKIDISERA
jgi:hypothetical protein